MGKPLTIQSEDEAAIVSLKKRLGAKSKIEVVREGLKLLEEKVNREDRIRRWQKAVELVAGSSRKVNKEYRQHSRLKRIK
ncbi:MAG: hypothetical protein H6626_02540 [Pseudobdellovibrionaceae bacterium]|nr:MAG: hypothetical protein H6626_02540 [Pseudobdellovibrionaceae bacterium]